MPAFNLNSFLYLKEMLHDIREDSFSNGITMHGLAIEIWIIWIFRAIKEQFMNYFSENSSVCGIVMSPKSPICHGSCVTDNCYEFTAKLKLTLFSF